MGLLSTMLGGDEWRDKPKEERAADISRYRASKKALDNSGKVVRETGPAFHSLNEGVIEAERHVPWWARL